MAANTKPNVLVLGGCGFLGRNVVSYLVENQLANKVRVSDKVLPELAGLSQKHQAHFQNKDVVSFKQANLSRPAMVDKVFDELGDKYDFVINLAGETKYSQTDEVYKENIFDVSVTCAKAAAARGVKRFIEVSTAQVYDGGKKESTEESKLDPWTKLAKAKLQAENEVKKIPELNYVIVRPAICYGPGDISGITPRLICGAVYKSLNETMEFLWDKDLRINTVHVRDVVNAIWYLCTNGKLGETYNLCDSNDSDQGKVNKLLEQMFGIKTDFMGTIKSKLATSVAMKTVAETANEKHLKPWSELCKAKNITNTPLTPYLDEELLYHNPLYVDGSKITKIGFTYQNPKMTTDLLREVIKYFVELNFFPSGLIA